MSVVGPEVCDTSSQALDKKKDHCKSYSPNNRFGYILVNNNFLSLRPELFHRLLDIIQPTTGTNSTAALRQAKWIKNTFCVHPFGSKGASSSLHQLIRYTQRLHFNPMLAPLSAFFPSTHGGGHASRLRCRRPADRAQPPPKIFIHPHGDAVQYGEPARHSIVRGSRLAAHSQTRSAGQHPVKHILSNYSQQPVRVTSARDGGY